jgi:hypothetical protein
MQHRLLECKNSGELIAKFYRKLSIYNMQMPVSLRSLLRNTQKNILTFTGHMHITLLNKAKPTATSQIARKQYNKEHRNITFPQKTEEHAHIKTLHSARRVYLCVPNGSHNKQ